LNVVVIIKLFIVLIKRDGRLALLLGVGDQRIRHDQKASGRPGDSQFRPTERQVAVLQIFQRSSEHVANFTYLFYALLHTPLCDVRQKVYTYL